MNKKTVLYKDNTTRHMFNSDITVVYELELGNEILKPGSFFKIKNSRTKFVFHCLAHNIKIDKTWVDCMDTETGEFRSFTIDRLVPIKRKRR